MVASLKFYEKPERVKEATDLSDAKVVVYEDGNGNKYTLDASNIAGLTKIDDIKLSTLKDVVFKYHPNSGTETTTTGLGNIISALFATQSAQDGQTILAEEVAKKPVVEAILKVTKDDGSGKQVKVVETELGTTFAKKDGTNIDKDFAGKVLDAKDGNDLVLTKKVAEKAVVKAIFSAKENANDPQSILVTEVAKEPVVKEILGVKNAAGTKTVLEEEVAKKPVVDALIPELAKDDGATGIYTKKGVDDELAKKADTAALTHKADKNYVDTELGKKAGAADLANKANTADVYTKTAADTAFVKATELKTKAAAKDVVDAIFDAKDGNNKISETKIGATFAKKNASNLTDAANQKAFAEAILPAKDGNKSILVDKLEGFLAENAKVYSNNTKTAKELLVPSDAEIAAKVVNDPNFTVNVADARIKEVVKETVSQPSFEIPTSDDAALNWTW
ncbi:hypothetical protein [Wolbachia endosymbiont (group A) of Pipizella viduata]|uniref:hypothetical protein n=1 Tax=Wolbachia endosymbiont (group A) of Pipizella viduata TaxID=3066154 RepID=UPI00333E5622